MHLPPGLLTRLGQRAQEQLPIRLVPENDLPSVTPVHHVIHGAGVFDAQLPRHARNDAKNHKGVNLSQNSA
jgi:hypothetical protein